MSNYPMFIRNSLKSIIKQMAQEPEPYVRNPGRDFTRNRKLSFQNTIELLLSMGGGSLDQELLEYFSYDPKVASSSAFVQQRAKLLPTALEYLFGKFTQTFKDFKTYKGYRLLAFDGTVLHIPHNPNDSSTYLRSRSNAKGYNLLHLNSMYDLCNKLYLDVCVQSYNKQNEHKALVDMVDRSTPKEKVLLICDRGLESYNNFAHIEEKGWKYLIRVKGVNSTGILSSLNLPSTDEFDQEVHLTLTKKQTRKEKAHPEIYKFLARNATFDYLDLTENLYYPITFRVVRVQIEEGYQCFITNLQSSEFTCEKLKNLYSLRWGIETSFRELKYALGLSSFHSKKVEYIIQEVFAKLIMYNFCEAITLHIVIHQSSRKYVYQVNFTRAMQVCKFFFKYNNGPPPNVEALIQKYILPIREDRHYPRKIKSKKSVSFNYRVA